MNTPNNKLLSKPVILISLVSVLLFCCLSIIFYVQRTLSEIEEALPITLSKHERDIRVLVNDMGSLVQNIGFARSTLTPEAFSIVIKQTQEVELDLEKIRENYRFNDVLGISAIHAKINPAIFDIKTWLTHGLYNFEPISEYTLKLVELRAKQAFDEVDVLLKQVGKTAVSVLTEQARRINLFRNIMIITLVVLVMMTMGLVMLGFRLQRMVLALKESEEQISYRANFDSLTQLPNRSHFIDHLGEAVARSRRFPGRTALLFIDLDRFKTINDTLGHDFGDELIKQVADRISETVRVTDVVSRLGGDEFTVLLSDMSDEFHASVIAKSILARLAEPFMLFGYEVYSGASIGITVCPQDGDDVNTLLKNADMAMYEAKDRGRNTFCFFTKQMMQRAQQFLELDKEMRRALARDEFHIHFQPIYEIQGQSMIGVEALLRWQHPRKGLIKPSEFIHVAEETGLIEDIGLWVLRHACVEALPWLQQDVHTRFYLAVNISMRQFKGGFDKKELSKILQDTGFPAENMLLEITESLLMDNDVRIKEVLGDFREMGVRLAVNHFGTGYSALSYLREFPVCTLKIDSSFIKYMSTDPNKRRLVEAIITMANSLNLVTIADGVETDEQYSLLSDLHCNMVQGDLYSRPIKADEIHALI